MPLNPTIANELITIRDTRVGSGDWLSPARLADCYATFRRHFGPEVLASLDGDALLARMHLHGNKDSLVYWLEFKNDEEMPNVFGSIAGGSALKFGIYFRKETGKWMGGSPQHQVELSPQEAIDRARKHRDEFVAGAAVLDAFVPDATDAPYRRLQQELQRVAPTVSESSWGHKYFSLLYPDKLDDFHAASHQRYHLIRLLQIPPDMEGRYVCAGRFAAIAHELDMATNHVMKSLVERNGIPHQYWRIGTRPGESNIPHQYWPDMVQGNWVGLGWYELTDLSDLAHAPPVQATKDELRTRIARAAEREGKNESVLSNFTNQVFNFIHLAEGDIVLASEGATVLGIGSIAGEYFYDENHPFRHKRPVKWLDFSEWKLDPFEGRLRTLHQVKDPMNLVEVERRVLEPDTEAPVLETSTRPVARPPRPNAAAIPRLDGLPGRIQTILDNKGQLILYGPPGTGKTYWAQIAARELAALHAFGMPFDKLDSAQRKVVLGTNGELGRLRTVTSHPAYGYEDFLEGFRPVLIDDQMAFVKQDGIFKRMCQDAEKRPDERFYLIIDEINRGDIPRIFGELLTVLEKDKRGQSLLLAVSGDSFRVPDNVFLIATMNTADRSIALLDAALRRRFGFIELMPDSKVLGRANVAGLPLGRWLEALNSRIREYAGRDARNLQVGHSYLLQDGRPIESTARLAQVVRNEIMPLIQEYTYEDFGALEKIMGSGLVDIENLRIHEELFEAAHEDDFIQSLLDFDPDMATTSEAVESEVSSTNGTDEEEESALEEDDDNHEPNAAAE